MRFLATILKPTSRDRDKARREFVLNILIASSLAITGLVASLVFISDTFTSFHRGGVQQPVLVGLFLFFLICWYFSKTGNAKLASYAFIGLYYLLITQLVWASGSSVPQALLMYALIVVMSGILVNSAFGFFMTLVITTTLILLNYLERSGTLVISHPWKQQPLHLTDSIVHSVTLFIIAVVSWLFNTESERAFHRAKISEQALKKERNSLALKVAKKTQELREEHAEKVAQVYKFAEFGKLTSGIVHDLSNSVMLVSANLAEAEQQPVQITALKTAITRARLGAKQLEEFILATRSRLNNREIATWFSGTTEVSRVVEIMRHKAEQNSVKLVFNPEFELKIWGSASKFHQLLSNLISNAIDAYDSLPQTSKTVTINLSKNQKSILLTVHDLGKGIPKHDLEKIFEPFFSTKSVERSTGLGLAITRDIVVKDFGGRITIQSKLGQGTVCSVHFNTPSKTVTSL